jgi:hypothetical protein
MPLQLARLCPRMPANKAKNGSTHFVAEAEKFERACSAKGAWHKEGYHHE